MELEFQMNKVFYHIVCTTLMAILAWPITAQAQQGEDTCTSYIPNAISVNSAELGREHQFYMRTTCTFDSFNIQVFNRWGELKFKSNKTTFVWDTKNEPTGTYYYVVQFKKPMGKLEEVNGSITVIR